MTMILLKIILILLATPITFYGFMYLFVFFVVLNEEFLDNPATNKIKFKTFIKFYNINPDSWKLCDGYVVYRKNAAKFKFNLIDFFKYTNWSEKLKHNKEIEMDIAEYQQVLEYVKCDLEEFERKNNEMLLKEAEKLGVMLNGNL